MLLVLKEIQMKVVGRSKLSRDGYNVCPEVEMIFNNGMDNIAVDASDWNNINV